MTLGGRDHQCVTPSLYGNFMTQRARGLHTREYPISTHLSIMFFNIAA